MARKQRDPFEVTLTDVERTTLAARLTFEIDEAINARHAIVGDDNMLDGWHQTYEGGDRHITKDSPWPGAANLTSWIGTEKVDAFRSRVVKTIFTEPIWLVAGWNMDPDRVSAIEQFHQWKAEEERLQGYLSKVVHNSLIEGTGVLEVSERPVLRKVRERFRAMVDTTPAGVPLSNMQGETFVKQDEAGNPVEAPEGTDPSLTKLVVLDKIAKTRGGPQYRVLSLKDFFILPGHAQERKDVWGFAKRVWKRLPELRELELAGVYRDVDKIGESSEREISPAMAREGQGIASQEGATIEKEIWEITFLDDMDGDGIQEWYVATLHTPTRTLLRVQRDDLGQARYLLFIPFPRTRFVYGYSLIGHKLETIIDEHTAWRNMIADRVKLVVNAPIKRLVGSLWNPQAVPWGPGAVIPVRNMDEVMGMVVPDLPASIVNREGSVLSASERVAGMNDTASGVSPNSDRTLGEVNTVFAQSMVRVEEVVHSLQEAMEDLFQIRHEIWKRTLREAPIQIPQDLQASLEGKGMTVTDGMFTAQMLEGPVRGKPKGSVETADTQAMRQDFIQFLTAITQFSQSVPTFGVLFQDPELGKQLLSQAVRVFRWENRDAINQAIDNATQKAKQMQASGQLPLSPTTGKPTVGVAHPPGNGAAPAPAPAPGGAGNAMTRGMGVPTPPQATPPPGRPPTGGQG